VLSRANVAEDLERTREFADLVREFDRRRRLRGVSRGQPRHHPRHALQIAQHALPYSVPATRSAPRSR